MREKWAAEKENASVMKHVMKRDAPSSLLPAEVNCRRFSKSLVSFYQAASVGPGAQHHEKWHSPDSKPCAQSLWKPSHRLHCLRAFSPLLICCSSYVCSRHLILATHPKNLLPEKFPLRNCTGTLTTSSSNSSRRWESQRKSQSTPAKADAATGDCRSLWKTRGCIAMWIWLFKAFGCSFWMLTHTKQSKHSSSTVPESPRPPRSSSCNIKGAVRCIHAKEPECQRLADMK